MLISDIRMKSRGVGLPKSASAASQLAQHTIQHPGITRIITMSTHSLSWPTQLLLFDWSACVNGRCFFFFSLIGSSNNNSGNSTEEVSRGVAVEKLDSVKKWGINTYKVLCNMSITLFSQAERDVMRFSSCWVKCMSTMQCTKQMFSERFGRGSRTVDLELEAQIDVLRETKNKYEIILRLATALTSHFLSMVQTQQALGDTFTELSQKSPELQVP